jgi:hypothetical protein
MQGALITFSESKAICPHCERKIPFDEIEPKFQKQDKPYFRMKCKCKRFVGVSTNIQGDFVAFNLKTKELQQRN